jgi:hypothetical protein
VSLFSKVSPFLISFAVTCTFFINFCSWIFQCGCRSLWAGAEMACNIHAAHGHHCPWCSHGHFGEAVVMIGMCAPQFAVAKFTRWNWPARTAAALAMFPIGGSVIALIFGGIDSYWTP